VGVPFTSDQFFDVFAEYNRSFWFVALALWFVSAAVLAGAWRNPRRWSCALMYLLATLWIWNAVAYHARLFTRINPAAWLFAALCGRDLGATPDMACPSPSTSGKVHACRTGGPHEVRS
jgi:Family of unknown function (DUF6064)